MNPAAPSRTALPRRLLYATSAGLGGTGLNTTSLEGVLASAQGGYLGRAVCYANRQGVVPSREVRSLQHHPVRLLSCLGSKDYYAAKKRYLDWYSARELRKGCYDAFHGWSGECFESLVEARLLGLPSVMDVPTWHRNKGVLKPAETKKEREIRLQDRGWRDWRQHLHTSRVRQLAEYDLADVLLMPSRKSEETFLAAGIPQEKLHYVGRGVDLARYRPAEQPPEIFRVGFVGALIKRKGVHHLIDAWKQLKPPGGELVLVGSVHEEIKPYLEGAAASGVRVVGFTASVQDELRRCAAFAFPSECEGFAKATLEAAACGLPLIATRESGDAVVDGETGILIPPNDVEALRRALEHACRNLEDLQTMGRNARQMVERRFTWEDYRRRVEEGYARALQRKARPGQG